MTVSERMWQNEIDRRNDIINSHISVAKQLKKEIEWWRENEEPRFLRRIEELIAENKLLREALKQEQEKFQLETLRTSECSVLLRRWNAQPRPGSLRFHQATDVEDKIYEWRKLVGDSEELLATPINLGRTKEPKP